MNNYEKIEPSENGKYVKNTKKYTKRTLNITSSIYYDTQDEVVVITDLECKNCHTFDNVIEIPKSTIMLIVGKINEYEVNNITSQ